MNAPPRSAASGPAQPDPRRPLGLEALNRLKWRCRRGLLENDLFIERFFRRHEETLTSSHAEGLNLLMALADNDLLDLLLARCEPEGELDRPDVRQVLAMLRAAPHSAERH
jgi:antitoxin CptB